MKRNSILLALSAALIIFSLSSYTQGPVAGGAGNVSAAGCNSGVGCHGASSSSTSVGIVLVDKTTNVPVSNFKYTPGQTYRLLLIGANVSGLTKFGFQMTSVHKNAVNTQAGTFMNLPSTTLVHQAIVGGIQVIEHSTILAAVNGVDSVAMDWKAPTTTDTVRFYYKLNAVNGNGQSNGDQWNGSFTDYYATPTAVNDVKPVLFGALYPNPATETLNVPLKVTGSISVAVYDASGRAVWNMNTSNGVSLISIPVSTLSAGQYFLALNKEGSWQTAVFTKK